MTLHLIGEMHGSKQETSYTRMSLVEPPKVSAFRTWLASRGGYIHPSVSFVSVSSGFNVIANEAISADASIVSCPFSLAITPTLSKKALSAVLKLPEYPEFLQKWNERQLMCTYICMHNIVDVSNSPVELAHRPYIDMLPESTRLLTSLHFTPPELELFRGTNIYGATIDRKKAWETEWETCRADITLLDPYLASKYTWERYLTAATYLSSRAFPSTLLSGQPSLVSTPESYPVLLPAVDSLNHARGQRVSWVVSYPVSPSSLSGTSPPQPTISLLIHSCTIAGAELFNNYGPKPNAELILGYGFSLPNNPHDTMVLKIGGHQGLFSDEKRKLEVGRDAHGAEPVWEAVKEAVREQSGEKEDVEEPELDSSDPYDEELWATEVLREMAEDLLSRLPQAGADVDDGVTIRPEVISMLGHYIEGQRDILHSLMEFSKEKEQNIIKRALEEGIQIV